ncbi:MAG: DUF4942 domain-containing protein [Thermodesulfobacteriota bacterium]
MLLAKTKELMAPQTLRGLVEAHDQARALVSEAVQLLGQAQGLLSAQFGEYLDEIMPDKLARWDFKAERVLETAKSCQALITKQGWQYMLKQTGVDALLTAKRKEEFNKALERGDAPAFTVENILGMLGGLAQDLDGYFAEAVWEVWNWLKPYRRDGYKTNDRSTYEIASKVIKSGVFNDGGKWLSHWHDRQLTDMDKVFHLLDGQGVPRYPDDLNTKIREQLQKHPGDRELTTAYFRLAWFKNGNCHIEFLRPALLQRFNAIAGQGLLKAEEKAA